MFDQSSQGYLEGYYDAFSHDPEPLFDDASPDYRAGWFAGWGSREIVRGMFNV